jgi:hypothetical protein
MPIDCEVTFVPSDPPRGGLVAGLGGLIKVANSSAILPSCTRIIATAHGLARRLFAVSKSIATHEVEP